jgi:hypothetical protein
MDLIYVLLISMSVGLLFTANTSGHAGKRDGSHIEETAGEGIVIQPKKMGHGCSPLLWPRERV